MSDKQREKFIERIHEIQEQKAKEALNACIFRIIYLIMALVIFLWLLYELHKLGLL